MRANLRRIGGRAGVLFIIMAVVGGGLAANLIYIQLLRHEHYVRLTTELQHRRLVLRAPRGGIYDRNGVPLALTATGNFIFADPELIKPADKPKVAQAVAPLLGMTPAQLLPELCRPCRYVPLVRKADDATVAAVKAKLRALKLHGVAAMTEPRRLYPRGTLACHVLGFVGREGRGRAGIECAWDKTLGGQDGLVLADIDARGRVIPGRREEMAAATAGGDVTLTIDARIQEIAEQALQRAVQAADAAGGTVIVADPATGDILALANWPRFDPNDYQKSPPRAWNNSAVTSPYEPGSTYKTVTAMAALEEGVIKDGQTVVHCTGSLRVGRRTINCAMHGHSGGHGTKDLRGVIVKSCNVGAATLGLKLGRERLYKYVHQLGFGQRTGVGLGGETAGYVPPLAEWKSITTANVAFGQGVSVTPLQLLAAYCVVANGGVLPQLHLVSRVRSGEQVQTFAPLGKRVVSVHTAELLRSYLSDVTKEGGTGTLADVPGYATAGKTGTAQKAPYHSGKYVGSFVGFVPADKPRLAILAMIDEPHGSHYGGVVAAPAFRETAQLALSCLAVPPTADLIAQAER